MITIDQTLPCEPAPAIDQAPNVGLDLIVDSSRNVEQSATIDPTSTTIDSIAPTLTCFDALPLPPKSNLTLSIARNLPALISTRTSVTRVVNTSPQATNVHPRDVYNLPPHLESRAPSVTERSASSQHNIIMGDADTSEMTDNEDAEGSIDDGEGESLLLIEESVPLSPPVHVEVEDVDMTDEHQDTCHPPPNNDTDTDMVIDGMSIFQFTILRNVLMRLRIR